MGKEKLIQIMEHDWEKLRYQAAIAAMQGFLSHGVDTPACVAKYSVSYADALIEELKKRST